MLPKPEHLGPEYGAQFQDQSVVAAYRFRPPYPDEVFSILTGLITDQPRMVLDAGCGDGAIARHLVEQVERIDAVDLSRAMIEQGKRLPNGDHPRLRWICAPMEDAPLEPPYALITAGASLHWMDWQAVLPRFRQALTPRGMLAMIYDETLPLPWDDPLRSLIRRCSTNHKFQPYDTIEELERRSLFVKAGGQRAVPIPFTQPIDAYIESFHARNGFSRKRMSREMAAALMRGCVPFSPASARMATSLCRSRRVSSGAGPRPASRIPRTYRTHSISDDSTEEAMVGFVVALAAVASAWAVMVQPAQQEAGQTEQAQQAHWRRFAQ